MSANLTSRAGTKKHNRAKRKGQKICKEGMLEDVLTVYMKICTSYILAQARAPGLTSSCLSPTTPNSGFPSETTTHRFVRGMRKAGNAEIGVTFYGRSFDCLEGVLRLRGVCSEGSGVSGSLGTMHGKREREDFAEEALAG